MRICKEDGCTCKVFAKNLCISHFRKRGIATSKECRLVGCENSVYKNGLCIKCYRESTGVKTYQKTGRRGDTVWI